MHTLVTDDDPAFRKALQGCGLDRQLCVVHMRRTVRRQLQRMRQGQDRIRPAPEDAAVLQGVVRLVQELPLWGGQLLLVCCEWAHQGRDPTVVARAVSGGACHGPLERPRRLRARPLCPLQYKPAGGLVWTLRSRARLARGLKTPQGVQAFLHLLAGNLA